MSRKFCVVMMAVVGLVFCSQVFGQMINPPEIEWEKTFGGAGYDSGYSVQQTTDGGYIVAGVTYSFGAGDWDVYLIKLNSQGNLDPIWPVNPKTFGGSGSDKGFSVQQTTDGGYIVAGSTYSFGAGDDDVYLIKLNSQGNLDPAWQVNPKTFGGNRHDYAYSVQQTTDGGYIIAGGTESFGTRQSDVYLIKLDSQGNLDPAWQVNPKTFGGQYNDWAYSVQQTTDGGYIVAGATYSFGAGDWDVYLIKLNSQGNLDPIWPVNQKTFGGSGSDEGFSVQQTTDGGYIVAGYTWPSTGTPYAYLIKLDSQGNLDHTWEKNPKKLGGSYGIAYSVQQTTDRGYIVVGDGNFRPGVSDAYLIKLDSQGNLDHTWQENPKTFGGDSWDVAHSVQQTTDGGYIVAGYTRSFGAGDWDVYLIKLAPELPIPPFSPSGVIAQLRTQQSAGISWQDNSANETGFVLERRSQALGGTGENEWQAIAQAPANTTMYIDSVLPPNTEATYRIAAKNANGTSPKVISQPITTPDSRWQLKIYDSVSEKWVDLKNKKQFNPDWGTAVLIHGLNRANGKDINDYGFQQVAKAMLTRRSSINVIAWDWMWESRGGILDISIVLRNMQTQVYKFRNAFFNLIPDDYKKPIQLFGHSLGCYFVAACVENELWAPNPRASKTFPDQITLWDPADLATFVTDEYTKSLYIDKLTAQVTAARRFEVYVDCYSGNASWTTHNSSIWVNVPGFTHYVYNWYAETAGVAEAPLLYFECFSEPLDGQIGFGASILLAPPNEPDRQRVKIAQCKTTGTLKFSKLSLCKAITGYDIFGLDPSQDCKIPLALAPYSISSFSDSSLKIASAGGGRGGDAEQSASIRVPIFIDPNWDYISFEFDFVAAPEPALLNISIIEGAQTQLLAEIDSDTVFNEDYLISELLSIGQLQGKDIELVFTLSSSAEGAEVRLKNLTGWTSAYDRNEPPIANAGDDQKIVLQENRETNVQLNASRSSDNEGDMLDYKWYLQGEFLASGVEPTIKLTPGNHIIELVVTDSVDHTASDTIVIAILIPFIRGDSNIDGSVDISDAINTLGFLFTGQGIAPCKDASDANDSGDVDISDAVFTLGFLFLGTQTPPAPYPKTGVDTTDDPLDCRNYGRKEN